MDKATRNKYFETETYYGTRSGQWDMIWIIEYKMNNWRTDGLLNTKWKNKHKKDNIARN